MQPNPTHPHPNHLAYQDHPELYQRLQAYSPDIPGAQFSFSQRLVRENGWTVSYAQRVINEYKRFTFLAMVAGHPVTPSDQVDQAWHLHLLYTHLYWEDFCPNVLQAPLHHGPTQGGGQERHKFHNWYDQTLASYRVWFGEAPPMDIWPPATVRFSRAIEGFQRINTCHHWVIPKVQWPALVSALFTLFNGSGFSQILDWPDALTTVFLGKNTQRAESTTMPARTVSAIRLRSVLIGVVISLLIVGVGCSPAVASPFNPLNFYGPQFLGFYSLLLMGTVGLTLWSRHRLSRNVYAHDPLPDELTLYDVAYLTGGPMRVAKTAIAAVLTQGHFTLSPGQKLSEQTPLPTDAHPLERAIAAQVGSHRSLSDILRNLQSMAVTVGDRLHTFGLVPSPYQRQLARLSTMPIFVVFLIGMTKIAVGVSRGRPTGFLQMLCWLTLGMGLFLLLRPLPYPPAVTQLLKTERSRSSKSVALQVALAGPSALHQWKELQVALSLVIKPRQGLLLGLGAVVILYPPLFTLAFLLGLVGVVVFIARQFNTSSWQQGRSSRRSSRSSSSNGVGCGYIPDSSNSSSSSGDSGCSSSGCSSSGCSSSGCSSSGCGGCGGCGGCEA